MAQGGTRWHSWHGGTPKLDDLTKKHLKKMNILFKILAWFFIIIASIAGLNNQSTLSRLAFLIAILLCIIQFIILFGKREVMHKREIQSKLINDEIEIDQEEDSNNY